MTVVETTPVGEYHFKGPLAAPLSIEPYVSKAFHETFMRGVFRRTWINIGRVEEAPNDGDYIVRRIPSVESGILVIRGRDGVLRAMHNVCPHRGNEVVWDDRGVCRRTLVCPFHGWAYGADGKLVHITDREFFPALDPDKVRLPPIHMQVWRGFIFVWIDGEPTQDLESFLGDFGQMFAPYPFERFQLHSRYLIDIKANWMVAMDAFQESYHARYLHADWTMAGADSRGLDYVLCGRHRRATFSNTVPPPREATISGAVADFLMSQGGPPPANTPGYNRKNFENALFDANVMFPNFGVHASANSYLAFRYWPTAHNRTTYEINHYNVAPANYAEALATAFRRTFVMSILREDLSTIERTQRALESGALQALNVSDDEMLIRHSHKVVTDAVADYLAEGNVR